MESENYMILEFPNKFSNDAFAQDAVVSFISQLDPTREDMVDIRTAVSEAVTNCIIYAYPNSHGTISLRCWLLNDNVLDIVVNDKGVGISDIDQARTPMFTTGGKERSGMGFTIMESFMDTLEVTSWPGKGTTVHMRRKIGQR